MDNNLTTSEASTTDIDFRFFSDDFVSDWKSKLGFYMMVIFLSFGCLGNVLTIVVIFKKPYLRTLTNILITNLGISDLLIGLLNPFYGVPPVIRVFNTEIACVTVTALVTWVFGCSLFNLVAIAVERYIAIIYPFHYQRLLNEKRMIIVSCCVWVYAALWPSLLFITNKFQLGNYCISESVYPSLFSYMYVDLHCVVSVSISLFCYYKIFKVALKSRKQIRAQEMAIKHKMAKDFKTAKMMCLILIFMLVAWTPFTIMHIYVSSPGNHLNDQTYSIKKLYVFVTHLLLVNSIVNPIVYSWQSTLFRRAYMEILGIKTTSVDPATSKTVEDPSAI